MIYRVICERLETMDRITDAVRCFHQMTTELGGQLNLRGEHSKWVLGEYKCSRIPCRYLVSSLTYHFLSDFRQRSFKKLEHLGDTAVVAQRYDEAISYYSTALSLNSLSPQGILIKRSKARLATGPWKQALDEANQVHHFCLMEVDLVDPSSGNRTRSVVATGLQDEV